MNAMTEYKTYSDEDKAALKALKSEAEAKIGGDIKLADMISAVTPGLVTPDHLKGV